MEKIKMLNTLFAISLIFILAGCGKSITGTNAELDTAHIGGPDCTKTGCHTGLGAGGTVFTNISGSPASGVTVKAQSISSGATITLGTSDNRGNFHYDTQLDGYYNMAVGNRWSGAHNMPNQNGCNRCHKWANPTGGASGRLY